MQKLLLKLNNQNGSSWQRALLFCFLVLGIAACKKDDFDVEKQRQKDEEIIKQYIADNNLTTAIRTHTGLLYITDLPGSGDSPIKGQKVKVHYRGRFLDGKIFDESYSSGRPIEFTLGVGQVIKGWDEGIALMKKGEKARLLIPSELGYGPKGSGPIPANSVLIFEAELISFQ